MTDIAKPTPGPWYFCPCPSGKGGFVYAGGPGGPSICDMSQYELPEQNGEFIAEAGTVYHETGLTPRQLLERVRKLESDIADMVQWGQPIIDMIRAGESDSVRDPWISGLEAALAKHGEGV